MYPEEASCFIPQALRDRPIRNTGTSVVIVYQREDL
jgi:hypothetical protein